MGKLYSGFDAFVASAKRHEALFRFEDATRLPERDCGREVLIQFPVRTPGDTLALLPDAAPFAGVHGRRAPAGAEATTTNHAAPGHAPVPISAARMQA